MPRKLQLNRETLLSLSEDQLSEVAGGTKESIKCLPTQSPICPSGATWLMSCESNIGTCG